MCPICSSVMFCGCSRPDDGTPESVPIVRRKWARGTITVEAAFLVPWTVLLLALLITMTFAIHNRTWYQTAALESALAGNQYVPGSGGNGRAGLLLSEDMTEPAGSLCAQESLNARIRDQAMPGSVPDAAVHCTRKETTVSVSGQRLPAYSETFPWQVEARVQKVRPASLVRGAWLVRELWDTWKGEES